MLPATPAGRAMVTWPNLRQNPHLMVSFGYWSPGPEIHDVDGSPSKALRGWSCGSPV
jgi:hypothetical protein